MTNLIVLTDKYPYGTGEPFIEAERNSWSVFNQVFICPVLATEKDTVRNGFKCKDNETLISTYDNASTVSMLVKGFKGKVSIIDLFREFKNIISEKGNIQNKLKKLIGIHINSNLRFKRICKELSAFMGDRPSGENILIYSYWMYEPVLVGIALKKYFGNSRLITRAHRYDLYEERHKFSYIPYRNLVFKCTDAIYTISEDGRQYLLSKTKGKISDKIIVRRLGTLKLFNSGSNLIPEKNSVIVVSCSNIIQVKRLELIINALKLTSKTIKWVHFGGGELEKEIKEKAGQLPENVQAVFMGPVPNEQIQEYYATHYIDAFINVSESEGVPVSIMEAQSYGIPVIATDVGGTGELVHDGENGVLLSKDFIPQDLLDAIEIVKKNSSSFRENAQETWRALSDAERNYVEMFSYEIEQLEMQK